MISILDDEALNLREQNKEIIHRKCGRHSYCQRFDINLLCFKPPMGGRFGTCECRPFTQWNNQTDELSGASHSSCQVYVVSSTLCFSHIPRQKILVFQIFYGFLTGLMDLTDGTV